MIVLACIPLILSDLLMAAHLYRRGSIFLAVSCLLLLFLLLIKNRWIPRILTVLMLVFAAEWIRTLTVFIHLYSENGQPITRLTIILGTVALVTLLSPLVFKTKTLKRRYNLSGFRKSE